MHTRAGAPNGMNVSNEYLRQVRNEIAVVAREALGRGSD